MKLAKKTGTSGGSRIEEAVAEQFAGLGIDDVMVRTALLKLVSSRSRWSCTGTKRT